MVMLLEVVLVIKLDLKGMPRKRQMLGLGLRGSIADSIASVTARRRLSLVVAVIIVRVGPSPRH